MTMQFDPEAITIGATAVSPVAVADGGRGVSYRTHVKRAMDVVLVLAAAPFVLPLVLLLALLVSLDGGRPFYEQERLGLGGRRFRMWKLRSMVTDADAALAAHLAADPDARAEWDRDQKLRDDPRVTRLGRLIRRTSLDELPQLWNVLTGDMSLVGPRPMLPEQRALYPGHAYFRLRPGLTGAWQVSDRNRTTFAARAEFDRAYDIALSLTADLAIIAATVGVVLRATGR
ncbi:sugar transferase [Jannaschia sp. S6380]|uniref:sugar transferase n=1 Tax=Jannaschia sp. S6380 TaxID=2926408 RepID=UPI001FF34440|nr:sugar transferase [Jannaschia sp. S6380]MCK0168703.1 sugar transferase [Jannaschia sp. S6380]